MCNVFPLNIKVHGLTSAWLQNNTQWSNFTQVPKRFTLYQSSNELSSHKSVPYDRPRATTLWQANISLDDHTKNILCTKYGLVTDSCFLFAAGVSVFCHWRRYGIPAPRPHSQSSVQPGSPANVRQKKQQQNKTYEMCYKTNITQ